MAKNSLESRLIEQSDMIMQLNKLILSLQQTVENMNAREAALLQEISTLKEQNEYLTKKLFGKSSEKKGWGIEGQMELFNEVEATRTTCWSHVRRYLLDAIPKGKQMDYTLPAVQGAMYVGKLFRLEKEIKQKYKNDFEVIKTARLEKEMPILEGFGAWFDKQHAVNGSRMAKALTYIQNRRPYMMTYLEDGRCSFCNNLSELEIKPVALGRKNYLFSDTPAGADSSAIIYSLVETAKANGINTFHYLWYLLEKLLETDLSAEAFERYLPWKTEVKSDLEALAKQLTEV